MAVRVFVVGDDPLYRAGLRVITNGTDTMEVAGEAPTGEEAALVLRTLEPAPDVIVMDLQFAGCSAVETLRSVVSGTAPAPGGPRLLVLSASDEDHAIVAALRAGARGYIVRGGMSREELLQGIRIVAGGGAVFCPKVAARLAAYFSAVHELPSRAAFPALTDREREVLDLLARGYSNRRIARELVLAEKTVRNHVSHVFMKLQVADRTAAAVRARDAGLGA